MDDPAIALPSQPLHQPPDLAWTQAQVAGRLADLLLPPYDGVQLLEPVPILLIQGQNILPSHVPSLEAERTFLLCWGRTFSFCGDREKIGTGAVV
jgi:hypothetical protein